MWFSLQRFSWDTWNIYDRPAMSVRCLWTALYRLIDELLLYNITPTVTLYHWDLPQALQDQGGWLNPDIAYWFEEYARTVFHEFGDRVKIWITLNEPWVVAINGHSTGGDAPGIRGPGILEYRAAHNLIRSHAKAYRVYQSEFYPIQQGKRTVP